MPEGQGHSPEITTVEPPAFAVRDLLVERGYQTGDFIGRIDPSFVERSQGHFGIFIPPVDQRPQIDYPLWHQLALTSIFFYSPNIYVYFSFYW